MDEPAVRRRARGGEVIQASRSRAARLTAAILAVALEAGVVVHAALLAGGGLAWVLAGVGTLAVLILAAGLRFSWTSPVPASIVIVGGVYAAALLLREGGVDGAAPFVATALLLAAELAYWHAASHAVPLDGSVLRRAAATAGALTVVAFSLGVVLLLVGGAGVAGGLPLEALGVGAAAAALAVVARLARG